MYSGWIQDLSYLCRSHHEDLSALRMGRFDARVIGNPGKTLNLRYLAALLRVADILEFDPERTPDVILKHRDIPAGSRIFWYRDHGLGLHLDKTDKQLILSARTSNALVHRAVLEVIDAVDRELALCAILEREGAFRQGSIPDHERDLYRWNWASRLTTDIAERDGSFVYIDGTFRPDSKRILELLSGTQLYHTPLAAVRELLQNATDAVREQIAHERLTKDTPGDLKLETALSQIHKIQIVLEQETDGRLWLRCSDDGVGMTREIIERHLLVSGSSIRPEVRALERSAKNFGFDIGRTGQFGIGVLSYFMIADRIEISTRRSTEAGDPDGTGWKFVTEGIAEFGQLERIRRSTKGTEISLRLKEQLPHGLSAWSESISAYCKNALVFAPCVVEFRDRKSGAGWEAGPRWTWSPSQSEADLRDDLHVPSQEDPGDRYETASQRERRLSRTQSWDALSRRAIERLRWLGPEEVSIPDVGDCRSWVPYFDLNGDASLLYFDTEGQEFDRLPDGSDFLGPLSKTKVAWRGFDAGHLGAVATARPAVVEANFVHGMKLSINRKFYSRAAMKRPTKCLRTCTVSRLLVSTRGSRRLVFMRSISRWRATGKTPRRLARIGCRAQRPRSVVVSCRWTCPALISRLALTASCTSVSSYGRVRR
jgi:Histidine kinase-, DNA gyrase B-, and HSP90-like ATPase